MTNCFLFLSLSPHSPPSSSTMWHHSVACPVTTNSLCSNRSVEWSQREQDDSAQGICLNLKVDWSHVCVCVCVCACKLERFVAQFICVEFFVVFFF